MELTLTDQNFEQEVLKSNIPVFVDFWAPWCGPCRQMGPIVEELAKEMDASKIRIGKMNVDENPNTPGTYGVMSIPTFIIFKNGEVADQFVGGTQKEKLQAMMEKHL